MINMEDIQRNIKYVWIMICSQDFIGGGAKFQFVNTVVSCFTYGGTSCSHPFQTIKENVPHKSGENKPDGITRDFLAKYGF